MRFNFRLAGAIALVLGVVSCSSATDGLTASSSSAASQVRLAINPTFSPAAARAYTALAANGADVTNIHIVLSDLGGRVVIDTTVAFPVGNDSISISLPLSIQGREEQFNAQVDLRDATGTIQFSTNQRVTARNSTLPPLPLVPLVLQYVGPGFSAKSVSVSPADASLLPGATQNLIATGADSSGKPVADLAVVWTTLDPTLVVVTQTGAATATVTARGPRGRATIIARTVNGIAGSTTITVLPQASGLTVVSGGGQAGFTLDTLPTPFTVELGASDGGTMSGVLVTFSAVTAGGSVASSTVPTDANGRASTRMVLGRDAGSYTYQAVSGTLAPVTVSASATAATVGTATQLIALSPLPSSFKVGVPATEQFSAQLADAKGYYVRTAGVVLNATLDITTSSGSKSQQSVRATSDTAGVITLSLPTFDTAGSVIITITVPVLNLSFSGTFPIS